MPGLLRCEACKRRGGVGEMRSGIQALRDNSVLDEASVNQQSVACGSVLIG